jgi:hypothetical protein
MVLLKGNFIIKVLSIMQLREEFLSKNKIQNGKAEIDLFKNINCLLALQLILSVFLSYDKKIPRSKSKVLETL